MGIFNGIDISASGLTAQRKRMDIISENIANVNTTRTSKGGPYKRKDVVFASYLEKSQSPMDTGEKKRGIKVKRIIEDKTPSKMIYNPSHPDANKDGYVELPNVEIVTETVNIMTAAREYDANVTALNASKSMFLKALEIGKR